MEISRLHSVAQILCEKNIIFDMYPNIIEFDLSKDITFFIIDRKVHYSVTEKTKIGTTKVNFGDISGVLKLLDKIENVK